MFDEMIPIAARQPELALDAPADLCLDTNVQTAPPSPDQVRTADAIFAARAENEQAAHFIGLYGSAMLLRDLTADALARNAFDEEEKRREDEERRKRKVESL